MPESAATTVRLDTPRTGPRLALGLLSLLPGAALVVFLLLAVVVMAPSGWTAVAVVVPGILLTPWCLGAVGGVWIAGHCLREHETAFLDGKYLVVRRRGLVWPDLVGRVPLDRIRGRAFEVREFRRDSNDAAYRPPFLERVAILDHGTAMAAVGTVLTAEEGQAVCDAMNRLIGAASATSRTRD